MVKKALGRQIEDLIPDIREEGDIFLCPVEDIIPNPYQPRRNINPEDLKALAESIKEYGVLQPIQVVRKEDKYMIVFGERRWRAATIAGVDRIPAIVLKDVEDKELLKFALIENIVREDLNPIEMAEAFRKLSDELGLSHEEIGKLFGMDRSTVTNIIRLLNLPDKVKKFIEDGSLTPGHGRALLSLDDKRLVEEIAEEIVKKGLSVRETENIVSSIKSDKRMKKRVWDMTESYRDASRIFSSLGADLKVKVSRGQVKLELIFKKKENLDNFIERLKEALS